MTQAAVNVELRMTVQDGGATPALERVGQAGEAAAGKIGQASERTAAAINRAADSIAQIAQRTATAQVQAADQAATAVEQSATRQRTTHERMSHAREVLGVRSEQAIQREIDQTEAAYARLMREGNLSWDEQGRAAEAMRQRVERLTNEMGKYTAEQQAATRAAKAAAEQEERIARGRARLQTAIAGGAAVAAGAYTLRDPARQAMAFDERLADMANTAFVERDVRGRQTGMKDLEAAINRSVGKGGGGTREQAAEALGTLIASGAVKPQDAMTMLPAIMRASAASGADAAELSKIGIRAQQTFRIAPQDMPRVLNMALAGGQAGGFELRDMSRWLPQQMAAASLTGLSGREGFARLVSLNQVAATTAGSTDEAGNNVLNLLAKINSADVAKDAKKQLGIDLPTYLAQQREKGVDAIDAFGGLVEQAAMKRQDYRDARAKLAGPQTDEAKRATLESMASIAQGAGIGTLIQDREAVLALVAVLNQKQYMADVGRQVRANDVTTGGAVDANYALMSGTAAFQLRQATQAKDAAQKNAMDGLTPAIGQVASVFGDLAQKYPALSGAVITATAAIGAMAAAAGGAAIVMGGGKIPGAAGALEKLGKMKGPSGAALKTAGKYVAPVAAFAGGWEIGSAIADATDSGGKLWGALNGDKQAGLQKAEADLAALRAKNQAMRAQTLAATVDVRVTDDRVEVRRANVAGSPGVAARLNANTGNVRTGAP